MSLWKKLICFTLTVLGFTNIAWACTDFRITAKDGSVLITRSLEFATDLKSNLRSSNRGRVFQTMAPDGKPGLTWKAKFGYLFLDGFGQDMTIDGINERGLSFEALYLPNFAQYQAMPVGKEAQTLPYYLIGDWILSSFDSVDQVKQALNNIYVVAAMLPGLGSTVFPAHFAIYEANGKGIIVEYVGGKLNIYDNQVGVFTNAPTYDWHILNLRNYVNLTPTNPNPVMTAGMTFVATGQGAGMLGLPGDISPPSRFVKVATLLRVAMPVGNVAGALNLGEHIINNVDIPLGLAREPQNGNFTSELTQWVVFKDLTNKNFYYRTYGDLSLRMVSLAKINFAENAPRLKMPIASNEYVQDMTTNFLQTKG